MPNHPCEYRMLMERCQLVIGKDPIRADYFMKQLPQKIDEQGTGWEVVSHSITFQPDGKSALLSVLLRRST